MSDTERLQVGRSVDGSLRDRIAAVIQENLVWEAPNMSARLADAVIAELDMGIPCAATGCRMRQITRAASDKEDLW